jgi:hypothetical protein
MLTNFIILISDYRIDIPVYCSVHYLSSSSFAASRETFFVTMPPYPPDRGVAEAPAGAGSRGDRDAGADRVGDIVANPPEAVSPLYCVLETI